MTAPTGYITVEEAADLSLRVADIAAWSAASDGQRLAAIVQASDEIDTLVYAGYPYGDWLAGIKGMQLRSFPRILPDDGSMRMAYGRNVPAAAGNLLDCTIFDADPSGNPIIPWRVKVATFYQALSILRDPQRLARLRDQHDGIAGQSAGGASETYTGGRVQILCLEAQRQMQPYLHKSGNIW